jgi:hypothetical protein
LALDSHLGNSDTCEPSARPVTPARELVLGRDAQNFNNVLKDNEMDGTGKGNEQVAEKAVKAFYDELIGLPVGERRELLRLAEADNAVAQKGDPAMPTIDKALDSNGFLERLSVNYPEPWYPETKGKQHSHVGEKATHYTPLELRYGGDPMCAEYSTTDAASATVPAAPKALVYVPPVSIRDK